MGLTLLLNGTFASSPAHQSSITFLGALQGLPVLELSSIFINLVLFLAFLFIISARRIFVCLGRIRILKDDLASNASSIRHNSVVDAETREVRVGIDFKFSVFCCFYVLFVQVVLLGFDGVGLIRATSNRKVVDWSVLCLPAAQGLGWFVLSFAALHCKFKVSEKFPLLLRVWWSVSFLICLCTLYVDGRGFAIEGSKHLRSHVVANLVVTPALAFLCFVAFRGVTGIHVSGHSDLQEPLLLEEEAGCLKVTPYHEAGLFSLATLSWLNPLLSIGAKRPLEIKDIPLLAPQDRAKTNYKILNSNWEKLKAENPSKQPSLAWAILKSFWKEAACNAIFAGLNTLVSYVGPFMISYFVDYLGGIETFPHEGYILAGTFFAAKLVETLTTRQWYLGVDILGMHVRSALTAMVYRKGLRLSSTAKQSHTSGEIVNYMAVDVQRIGDYSWYLHDMWMLPMQIILALAILYKNVGIASVATLIATIISIVLTVPVAKIQEDYQDKLMTAKDERMRKTSECLRNMRILKLQAWEDRYRLMLEEMRGVEFKWLRKALYSQAFITFMFWSSPIFVSAVTFGTSIFLGHHLTAGGVLSALATFRILQEPLRNFPDLVSMMAQTKVSLDRISGFLQEEELQEDATIVLPRGITKTSVEIKDGAFSWDPSSTRPTLSGIQMKVERGMRVAVCGMVGSGKSSFLSCILGEIPKISGEVKLCGTAAYVPQSAWIQSGNIEENILFGSPMDKPKYKKVIHACSLKKDLELFSHGDQTIIGDRGINLSGGQKQRVQLARALYQDADIYLLDDPFSAVDAHTGSELFKEYILTALEDKTVIFVTHQVEFLPAADLILVLKGGRIIQAGKYDDLLQAGTDFKSLVSAHHEAIEAMDIPNYSSGDSDQSLCPDGSIELRKNRDTPSSSVDCLAKEVQEGASASEQKAIKDKKKAKRSRKKQLVQEEERGRVQTTVTAGLDTLFCSCLLGGLLLHHFSFLGFLLHHSLAELSRFRFRFRFRSIMAATAQLRYSTVARHHSNPSDNRRFSNNPNSSISFPYSKTLNRAISFVPKPIWDGKPELSFSGGNGDDHSGAGAGGNSGGWSRGGGDGNSDDSSSSSSSAVQGFGVLGMFLNGWRSRVAADPQFPFKVLMEEVVGVSSCVLGDMASRPNFGLNELDFVFSTLVVGSILNFTLMYLLAPTLSASAATLPSIFASCPASHMFEPGSYGLVNRLGTFVYKGAVFAAVGFAAGLAGTALSNGLIKLRKKMDPNFETPNKPPPTLLNALTWAAHMGISSNLRYQTLNGAEFLLEKGLPSVAFKTSVVVLRCLNNVLGGVSFVVLARLTGSQSVGEAKSVERGGEVGSAAEKEKLVEESEDLQSNQSTYK